MLLTSSRAHRRPPLSIAAVILVGMLAAALAACGAPNPGASASPAPVSGDPGASLHLVATTTVFADMARNVGGDRVTVSSIMPAGAGPEDYEPKPEDARKLADADLIISNGVGLDDFLDNLIAAAGEGAVPHLVLGDGIPAMTVGGEPNPHFWLDPSLVKHRYLPAIAGRPERARPWRRGDLCGERGDLPCGPRGVRPTSATKLESIPASDRKLVTFHDAFPYFARHYGFELVGVILPNGGQEPSANDLAALVDTVKSSRSEGRLYRSAVQPELAKTLASEAGVTRVVTTLYNDAVGPPPNDTYLGHDALERRPRRGGASMSVETVAAPARRRSQRRPNRGGGDAGPRGHRAGRHPPRRHVGRLRTLASRWPTSASTVPQGSLLADHRPQRLGQEHAPQDSSPGFCRRSPGRSRSLAARPAAKPGGSRTFRRPSSSTGGSPSPSVTS